MPTALRGFFCADLTLRYPYHACTITIPMLAIYMLLLPMLTISVIEIIRICQQFRLRQYLWNLWCSLVTFSFGFIATYLTTELAKNVIKRLRPHFLAACQPRLPDGSTCDDIHNQYRYIEQYQCTNRHLTARQLRELYVSFPSAHASLSFYAMLFLIFYLHKVWWQRRGMCRVLRYILQFLLLMVAWYIALSRVADFWHHWSDVLAGIVMGVVYAIVTSYYIGGLLHRKDHQQQHQHHKSGATVALTRSDQLHKDSLMHSDNEWKLQQVMPA